MLFDGITEPRMHFAVEEALLRGVADGTSSETLRLRRCEPSVWIGVHQYPNEDVDLGYCEAKRLTVVRRPNPGGAVYQDAGSLCFTAFFNKSDSLKRLGISEPGELYRVLGEAIIRVCARFGVEAAISPVNDVTVAGRKVYGSAQLELYGGFAHSGSLLVGTDLDAMQKALRPSNLKFEGKGFKDVRSRVTSLSEVTGKGIKLDEVQNVMVEEISRAMGVRPSPGGLSEREFARAKSLFDSKYGTHDWTFRERGKYTTVLSTKAKSGVVTVSMQLDGDKISRADIHGDFLLNDQGELERVKAALNDASLGDARGIVARSALPGDVKDAVDELLIRAEAGR